MQQLVAQLRQQFFTVVETELQTLLPDLFFGFFLFFLNDPALFFKRLFDLPIGLFHQKIGFDQRFFPRFVKLLLLQFLNLFHLFLIALFILFDAFFALFKLLQALADHIFSFLNDTLQGVEKEPVKNIEDNEKIDDLEKEGPPVKHSSLYLTT